MSENSDHEVIYNESLRDKTKRSMTNNNNFPKTGYMPVDSHSTPNEPLKTTGTQGRKTFAFWTLVGLLFILAIGNLALTMTILGVLRLGQGMQSLELVPEYGAIKFYGNTEFDDVYKRNGKISSFNDYPLDISAMNGSIFVKLLRHGRSSHKLLMDRNGTTIRNTNKLEIRNKSGQATFTTESPTFNLKSPLENLASRKIYTNRLVSPIGHDLKLETSKEMTLRGVEGTTMESRELKLLADADLLLKSMNGSIILGGKNGVFVDTHKLPKFVPKYGDRVTLQYKICVCMPQGKLFKIPVTKDENRVYCDRINVQQFNPCI